MAWVFPEPKMDYAQVIFKVFCVLGFNQIRIPLLSWANLTATMLRIKVNILGYRIKVNILSYFFHKWFQVPLCWTRLRLSLYLYPDLIRSRIRNHWFDTHKLRNLETIYTFTTHHLQKNRENCSKMLVEYYLWINTSSAGLENCKQKHKIQIDSIHNF